MLEAEIRKKREHKDILLMTHIVLGYPSFEASIQIVDAMVASGVDLIELQIPFSEPMADGPVILHANQRALEAGASVERCFQVAASLAAAHPSVEFVLMTYYNIAFRRGAARFARDAKDARLRGAIIPDLPFEEGEELFEAMIAQNIDPIFLFSPSTSDQRMSVIAQRARGFVYCVARKGVTGATTEFATLDAYLSRCRNATALPLALGFGVKSRADIDAVVGKVDIAVVGSETIRVAERDGIAGVAPFIRSLR